MTVVRSRSIRTHDDRYRSAYIEFIQSCYRYHPEAFSYYDQLVDFINHDFRTEPQPPQKPTLFELQASFEAEEQFPFVAAEWERTPRQPRVAVLEGFPSPSSIALLGAKLLVRPEFFIGHLFAGFQHSRQLRFYEFPTLPSRQSNVVSIHFTSLVKPLVNGATLDSYLAKRKEVEDAIRRCDKTLFNEGPFGATRFRAINQHDSYFCSVEQTVSLTVVMDRDQWVGKWLCSVAPAPS
jgi:hypothetical protein